MSARIPLWLAAQGLHVFPLRPGTKFPYGNCERCRERDGDGPNPLYIPHTPADCRCLPLGRLCHGLHAATTDPDRISEWWSAAPKAGIGVTCGPSNVVVVDVDNHGTEHPTDGVYVRGESIDGTGFVNGYDTMAALCELRGTFLPWIEHPTLTVLTPSGGLQAWFRVPDGMQWRQGNGVRSGLGWQVDVKAGMSFGIMPPTATAKGAYTPIGDTRAIAPLPAWLGRELAAAGRWIDPNPAPRPTGPQKPLKDVSRYTATAVERELATLAAAQRGTLHESVRDCAYNIGQLVGAGLIDWDAAHDAITAAAAQAGVSPDERKAQNTIRDGLNAGMRSPRRIGAAA